MASLYHLCSGWCSHEAGRGRAEEGRAGREEKEGGRKAGWAGRPTPSWPPLKKRRRQAHWPGSMALLLPLYLFPSYLPAFHLLWRKEGTRARRTPFCMCWLARKEGPGDMLLYRASLHTQLPPAFYHTSPQHCLSLPALGGGGGWERGSWKDCTPLPLQHATTASSRALPSHYSTYVYPPSLFPPSYFGRKRRRGGRKNRKEEVRQEAGRKEDLHF